MKRECLTNVNAAAVKTSPGVRCENSQQFPGIGTKLWFTRYE